MTPDTEPEPEEIVEVPAADVIAEARLTPADAIAPMQIRVPARGNKKLRRVLEKVNADSQIKAWWHVSNVNAVIRLQINDHSWVHIQIVSNIALRLLRLLVKHGVEPSLKQDYDLSADDSEVVVVLAALLHDIGMSIHRRDHEDWSLFLAEPKMRELLDGIYEEPELTVVVSEVLQTITSHRADGEPLTLEAGVLRVADALDMAKGCSRIPFERGSVSIHSLSAAAVDEVRITDGDTRPVMVEIVMNNSSGIYQVDGLLKAKLRGSGLEPYVEVVARIDTEAEKRLFRCTDSTSESRKRHSAPGTLPRPLRGRLTVGRPALDREVGVRIPAPQPRRSLSSRGYARDTLSYPFVSTLAPDRGASANVRRSRDTSGPVFGSSCDRKHRASDLPVLHTRSVRAAPCPRSGGNRLRALLVGLFAFCLVTQASAATMQGGTAQAPRKAKVEQRALTLDERLERKVAALRKYRGTIRFFENRRSLLSASDQRTQARSSLAYAKKRVRQLTKTVAALAREGACADGTKARVASAARGDLHRLRVALPGGARHRLVRVAPLHESPERPVPRALPDGLVRAPPVRPRAERSRPGRRSSPVLRALRSRLEPLGLSLGSVVDPRGSRSGRPRISSSHRASDFVANCTPTHRSRVSLAPSIW